jgi:hypothetical protein
MQERRQSPRSRVFKSAQLVVDKSSLLDCVVRNLTSDGARVEIPNPSHLPDSLHLTFDRGHSLRSCRIVWRGPKEAGLEFKR